MRRGYVLVVAGALLAAMVSVVAPAVSAEPECAAQVAVRAVTLTVDGEAATGRVYEPSRCGGGDFEPTDLVVAVHGHDGSSADYAGYLTSISRRTGTPVLSMDARSADSVWRTGDWNLWAGWRDIVAAHGPRGLFDYRVDNYGPADDFTMWLASASVDPALPAQIERDAGGCPPVVCPQAYVERSPALVAGRMDVRRAFLIHGTGDDVVPYPATLEMRAGLLAAGKPTSMYTIVTGHDLNGAVVPGDHSVGPAFFEGGCVVERLLLGTEPTDGPDRDYLVDVAHGIATGPATPPNAKCAA
ncbi:alpha/beta hydrolase family protein [Nocardia sp. CA-128927]|uniref:alpha/beta hydrolase family protein n=1 Tax=Nocardia sp. CA-128927 TaxID=3239975 RepID=UPI003D980EDF